MEPDVLGAPYQRRTIDLGTDDEGPVVATLVSRAADAPAGRAVLYVHGFNDYFFQEHIADFYVARGIHFYAVDLRKHGRSLLPHQTPNFIRRVSDYFPELDEAARIVRAEEGHTQLLVNAHSTGGLIAALWAHEVRDDGVIDGLFLNSPFFDFNVARATRVASGPLYSAIARFRPYAKVRSRVNLAYGHSIHADHHGEWRFDVTWKPIPGFAPRTAWISAMLSGQARLRAGLDIRVPVLVACSARSYKRIGWTQEAQGADAVLNVEHIARYAWRLGRHVTIVRIENGLHDLTLSGPAARQQVFAELDRWQTAYLTGQ